MRSAFRGPAHQLAVRMRINNCTRYPVPMAIIIIMAQATSHAPRASNCACAEGLHFSAFHYTGHNARLEIILFTSSFIDALNYVHTVKAAQSIIHCPASDVFICFTLSRSHAHYMQCTHARLRTSGGRPAVGSGPGPGPRVRVSFCRCSQYYVL